MIAVRSWERAKGMARMEFVAGMRALADYRRANNTARSVAALFSGARDHAAELAKHSVEENKELHRRVRALEEVAAHAEAEELLRDSGMADKVAIPVLRGSATAASSSHIIARIFSNRDAESLKQLAHALIAHPNVVALLASRDQDTARLVFARSTDAAGDMNTLMKDACALLEGRGGGKPDFAQGGGAKADRLEEALALAREKLSTFHS